jgi:hypothetical protein
MVDYLAKLEKLICGPFATSLAMLKRLIYKPFGCK